MIIGGKTIKNDNAAAAMKLYGEIFSGTILILTITALVRKIKEDPEKVFAKSLKRYANTTQISEATFARLKKNMGKW